MVGVTGLLAGGKFAESSRLLVLFIIAFSKILTISNFMHQWIAMSTTIEDRFVLILREQITSRERDAEEREKTIREKLKAWWSPPAFPGRGAWEAIEKRTGISAQSWRSAYTRRQKPTTLMIEALSQLFPKYAFWLVTGVTDGTNGHVAPMTALTFPERLYREPMYANLYFKKSIDLSKRLYELAEVDTTNEKQRMYAVERTMPLAHWIGGPLVATAYKVAATDEYKELQELWREREAERKTDIERIEGRERPWVKRLDEVKKSGAKLDPILGSDPRTAHQDQWDLFYIPKSHDDQTG